MLGLSGVQQQQPYHRHPSQQQSLRAKGRRCLYCQQQGCPGLQNCWWPRLRSLGSRPHRKAEFDLPRHFWWEEDVRGEEKNANAMEENLRAQIRVLEHEVQLLRAGLHNIASVNRRGKKDVATMTTPDVHPSTDSPFDLLFSHSFRSSGSGLPPPRHPVVSPLPGGILLQKQQQQSLREEQQQQPVRGVGRVDVSHPQEKVAAGVADVSATPPLQGDPEMKDVEGLDHLLRELTAQNVTLCRRLAEMEIVLEQRDTLLQSILAERLKATHASSSVQAFTSAQLTGQPKELFLHLKEAQEEVAHLREEIRHLKTALKGCEANLEESNTEAEELRRQIRPLTLSSKESNITSATPPLLATDGNAPSLPTAAAAAAEFRTKGPTAIAVNESASVPYENMATDAASMKAEMRELQERLASAERKVLAWESWYREQTQQPSFKEKNSRKITQEGTDVFNEEKVFPVVQKSPQRASNKMLRALPVAAPANHVNWRNVFLWQKGMVSDALTIDTYALMAREAALRQVAEQARADVLAALMTDSASDDDQQE
ncbi:hypothetical protein MOQ_004695 [Trypanosoma cruzi marinkellei]|uniref:Uncharacterized protein n=1 Tax=Trypanosoma cruzi marinkellei TaxID=85056 RepID=K2N9E1_TRYCR|nr:hypothetical protein MOQ_004695 [Trypanosoma cruzi marinkellei]